MILTYTSKVSRESYYFTSIDVINLLLQVTSGSWNGPAAYFKLVTVAYFFKVTTSNKSIYNSVFLLDLNEGLRYTCQIHGSNAYWDGQEIIENV